MKSLNLSLNSVDNIKKFTNIIATLDGEFDLVSGRYIVDAKSIMGIFSLDLTKDIRLEIHNDETFNEVCEKLNDFIAK